MTPACSRPDLRRIGERAFMDVLGTLLSLSATLQDAAGHSPTSGATDRILSSVPLAGQRLAGGVHLHLPPAFLARAIRALTGVEGAEGTTNPLLDDAAGEIANMVAGRVAARLAADGYPCTLGTPAVSRGVGLPIETRSGVDHGRADLVCEGHWLTLELRCRIASQ